MIRRLKKDVLSQLPKKIRVVQRVAILDSAKRSEMHDMLAEIRSHELSIKEQRKLGQRKKARPGEAVEDDDEEEDEPLFGHSSSSSAVIAASTAQPVVQSSVTAAGQVVTATGQENITSDGHSVAPPPPITSPDGGELMYDSQDENVRRVVQPQRKSISPLEGENVLDTTANNSGENTLFNAELNPNLSSTADNTTNTVQTTLPSIPLDDGELKKQHKHLLMALFNQSGIAKLPAIMQHLSVFLDNKLSGKVCNFITSLIVRFSDLFCVFLLYF
jgi:hypothetical protein